MSQKGKFLKNIKLLTITFMVSLISIFIIFPLIMNLHFIKDFLNSGSIKLFTGITALNLIILILTWEKAHKLWERYKNTSETKNFQFIYIEIIGFYLVFTVYLGIAFLSLSTSNEFQYFMGINLLLFLIWFFSSLYIKMKISTKEESKNKDSLSDEPITSPEQDKLRRKKFIDELYDEIKHLPEATSDSFTLGLHGSWGEGKTSVINLLVNKFENNQDFLVVNFDPWYFENEDAILKSFYTQIEKAIQDKFIFPDFKRAMIKYQKAISTGISFSGFKFDLESPDRSIEELKKKIEKYIAQIGKKLLIIIDDIDRLQPEESLLILKLVRKNTNFRNTIFLLSLDPEIIEKFLMDPLKIDPDFLDKIVQKPIPLPAIEQNCIDDFLISELEEFLKVLKMEDKYMEKLKEEFLYLYQAEIKKFFKTLRQAKRYINGLKATFPSVKDEVNYYDFLVLECIRIFNYKIYRDIWTNPWCYIGETFESMYLTPLSPIDDVDRKNEIIKSHIDTILESTPQERTFKEMLAFLFPGHVGEALKETSLRYSEINRSTKSSRVEKRICNHECFEKYFLLQVPSNEISDESIETIINSWNSKEEDIQKEIIKETFFRDETPVKRNNLLQKFIAFREKMDPKLALSFIEVIYLNINKFSKGEDGVIFITEYHRAESLMLNLIADKIEKEKIQNIITDVVLKTPDLLFAVRITIIFRDRGKPIYNIADSIDIKYLMDKVIKRLEEYFIKGKKDFFECINENYWASVLKQWATNWLAYDDKYKEIVSDYVLSLVKDDAKKFSKFLMKAVNEKYSLPDKPNFGGFERVYEYKEFEKIAKKYKDDEQLSEEERKTINIFLEHVTKLAQ